MSHPYISQTKHTTALVTSANHFLGAYLIQELLTKGFHIYTLDTPILTNYKLNASIRNNPKVQPLAYTELADIQPDYVFHTDFYAMSLQHTISRQQQSQLSQIQKTYIPLIKHSTKHIFITSLHASTQTQQLQDQFLSELVTHPRQFIQCHLVDCYGPGLPLKYIKKTSLFYELLHQATTKKTIKVPQTQNLYFPTYVTDVTQAIVEATLSPAQYNNPLVLARTQGLSLSSIAIQLQKYVPSITIKPSKQKQTTTMLSIPDIQRTIEHLNWQPTISFTDGILEYLKNTIPQKIDTTSMTNNFSQISNKVDITPPRLLIFLRTVHQYMQQKIQAIALQKSRLTRLAIITLIIINIPFAMYLCTITQATYYTTKSYYELKAFNFKTAQYFADKSSQQLITLRQLKPWYYQILKHYPYKFAISQIDKALYIIQHSTQAMLYVARIADSGHQLFPLSSSDTPPNPVQHHQTVLLSLSELSKEISLLNASIPRQSTWYTRLILSEDQYDSIRGIMAQAPKHLTTLQAVGQTLPYITGYEQTQKYLVIFQNNNELRPTGGFIGSFALVEFNQGRFINHKVYDVYQADGQLRGYVSPPDPISRHLGEPAWYLRDANWDPDFPSAAQDIQWFLSKELNESVAGVIALDIQSLKTLIKPFTPIDIPGISQPLTEENIDTTIQSSIETNFFPGSQFKQDVLSQLSTLLLTEVKSLSSREYINLANSVKQLLDQKHILLQSNYPPAQQLITQAGWDGGLTTSVLGSSPNTIIETLSINEANLGVNKVNKYISREISHHIDLTKEQYVPITLTLNYTNNSTTKDKFQGDYKNYLRTYIPQQAQFKSAIISNPQKSIPQVLYPDDVDNGIQYDQQEIGFLVNILAGEQTVVQINYQLPNTFTVANRIGTYQLHQIKQPGTNSDPYQLSITYPPSVTPYLIQNNKQIDNHLIHRLTNTHTLTYNTDLSLDRNIIISFKTTH